MAEVRKVLGEYESDNVEDEMRVGKIKDEKARSVLVGGEVFLYKDKAPWDRSGFSIKGALEYDPEDDTVRCHECGQWFRSLTFHLPAIHGITSASYKARHDLKQKTALISEGYRVKLINHGHTRVKDLKAYWSTVKNRKNVVARALAARKKNKKKWNTRTTEHLNELSLCPPQAIEKIRELANRLHRTPTTAELEEAGIPPSNLRWTFGSITNAMKLAELDPHRHGHNLREYSKDELLQRLRTFVEAHGRAPARSDLRRDLLPSEGPFIRVFGSWRNVIKSCGMPVPRKLRTEAMDNKAMLALLARAIGILGRAPSLEDQRELKLPHRKTYSRRFGSWARACRLAGGKSHDRGRAIFPGSHVGKRRLPLSAQVIDKFYNEVEAE